MKPNLTLEETLEKIFTIDGQGRPAKAALFIKLLEQFEIIDVEYAIREISQRKFI